MSDCVFCKIIKNELKSEKLFEDEKMIIIRDLNPQAKNHFLAIPKQHYPLLNCMTANQAETLGACISAISKMTDLLGLQNGFRLVINQGDDAGQTVHHLHIHILSGEKLSTNFAK